jgi:N-methylhydantoinase A
MEARGRRELAEAGLTAERVAVSRSLDLRYVDQIHECQVAMVEATLDPTSVERIAEAFHQRHEELYTYCERDNVIEMINLESTSIGQVPRPQLPALARGTADPQHALIGQRQALFEDIGRFTPTPVFDGGQLLVGNVVHGPAIIEEETTTVVVFPGWRAELQDPGMYVCTPEANSDS